MSLDDAKQSILADLSKMATDYENLRKQFQKDAQERMKGAFKEVFDEYPDVDLKIVWTQYTPAFNDGEPCEFTMGEVSITNLPNEDICSSHYDVEDEEVYTGDPSEVPVDAEYFHVDGDYAQSFRTHWKNKEENAAPSVFQNRDNTNLQKLLGVIQSHVFEEVLKGTFGDGSKIIASRAGFDVGDYDCGY